MKRIFALSCGFYLLIGITSVVLGALLPVLLTYYERGYSDGGFLLFLQFLGFLVGVLVAPALTARIGRKAMLTLALICIVAAYTLLGFLPSWSVVLLLTIIVGFGSGIIEPSVGAFTIEFTENQKAVAMSKLDVFFALGALLIPAVAALFIWMDQWHLTFYTVAVLSLVLMLLWITMPRPAALYLEQAGENTVAHTAGKAQYSRKHLGLLTIFVIFFFIYMGLELGLMNFLPSILVERLHLQESVASLSVSILWIAMIIGRLFSGKIAEAVNYMPFLIWSTVGTLFVYGRYGICNWTVGNVCAHLRNRSVHVRAVLYRTGLRKCSDSRYDRADNQYPDRIGWYWRCHLAVCDWMEYEHKACREYDLDFWPDSV